MFRRSVGVASLAIAALLLAAQPATAEEIFAGPDSTRTTAPCVIDDPCRLDTALTLAAVGDTVSMIPGEYFQAGTTPWAILPDVKTGVVVEGSEPGEPPLIHGLTTANATPFIRLKSGSTLQDVEIEMTPSPALLFSYAVTIEAGALLNRSRIEVTNPGGVSLTACLVGGGTIRNSVCTGFGTGSVTAVLNSFTGSDFTTNVINTTAISNGTSGHGMRVGISSANTSTLNITNSIARGPTADLGTGTFTGGPVGTAIINVQYSNWNTYTATGMGTNQINSGAGNQTGGTAATPVFVDAAIGDYREDATSPTIDAGLGTAVVDSSTLDGTVRTFGAAPDIGAYEFVPPPSVSTDPATGITSTAAVLEGKVNPNGSFTRVEYEYGPTPAYGQTIELSPLSFNDPEVVMSAGLAGLTPDTTYHYRLKATSNGGGTATGGDLSFTTAPAVTPVERLTLSALKVRKKWSLRKGTVVRFQLSRAASVRLVFERRKGKRFVTQGVKVVEGKAGANEVRLKRKLKGKKKLRTGRYRLKVFATAADGERSSARTARFRIRR